MQNVKWNLMTRGFHLGLLSRRDMLGEMSSVTSDLHEYKILRKRWCRLFTSIDFCPTELPPFIPELKAEVSLLLHDTCDRTFLLEDWLVLVRCMVKRWILTRRKVEGCVVVERGWKLEDRGRNLLFLNFTISMVRLLARGRSVHPRKVDCEQLHWAPWRVNSR